MKASKTLSPPSTKGLRQESDKNNLLAVMESERTLKGVDSSPNSSNTGTLVEDVSRLSSNPTFLKAPRPLPKEFKRIVVTFTAIVSEAITIGMYERDLKQLLEYEVFTCFKLEDLVVTEIIE